MCQLIPCYLTFSPSLFFTQYFFHPFLFVLLLLPSSLNSIIFSFFPAQVSLSPSLFLSLLYFYSYSFLPCFLPFFDCLLSYVSLKNFFLPLILCLFIPPLSFTLFASSCVPFFSLFYLLPSLSLFSSVVPSFTSNSTFQFLFFSSLFAFPPRVFLPWFSSFLRTKVVLSCCVVTFRSFSLNYFLVHLLPKVFLSYFLFLLFLGHRMQLR